MIQSSELIINPKGEIYHLALRPEQVATTVFTVGDPDRVGEVSKHFDRIEHRAKHREFVTHTGTLGNKRLTVLSTGIGTDNIDIVLNELDALFNIDFETRMVKPQLTSLDILRIGTSGSLSAAIPVDDFVVSAYGAGLDNLLPYYGYVHSAREKRLRSSLVNFGKTLGVRLRPDVAEGSAFWRKKFAAAGMHEGITLTAPGFYAPQGRYLRARGVFPAAFFDTVGSLQFEGLHVTNFEMETSGIYGLAKLMGHRAASCNVILANRVAGTFSKDPARGVRGVIEKVLEAVVR